MLHVDLEQSGGQDPGGNDARGDSGTVFLDREMRKERGIEAGETGHVHRPGRLERCGSWRHAMDIVG